MNYNNIKKAKEKTTNIFMNQSDICKNAREKKKNLVEEKKKNTFFIPENIKKKNANAT